MIAFASMLIRPAEEAGMKCPTYQALKDKNDEFNPEKFPHFAVFCNVQLGQAMPSWTAHWENAKIIAAIPEDKIRTITLPELLALGLHIKT